MAKHGELIEISADAFQLMEDRLEFLYLVDRLSERRDSKVFATTHAGFGGDPLNGIPLAIGHPKRLFSVSFATLFGQSFSPLFFCKSGFGLPPEKNNAFGSTRLWRWESKRSACPVEVACHDGGQASCHCREGLPNRRANPSGSIFLMAEKRKSAGNRHKGIHGR